MLRDYTRRPLSLRLDNVVEGKTEYAPVVSIEDWRVSYPKSTGGVLVWVNLRIGFYNLDENDEPTTELVGMAKPDFMAVDANTAVDPATGEILYIEKVAGVSATNLRTGLVETYPLGLDGKPIGFVAFLKGLPGQYMLQHLHFAETHDTVTPMSIHNMLFANLQQAAYLLEKFGPVTLPAG